MIAHFLNAREAIPLACVLAALLGCESRPVESPHPGAPPPVRTPVGPIPGPGAAATVAVNPLGGNRVAMVRGRELFVRYNCAGCHGGHAGGGMGPSLRDKTWRYGNSDAHIFDSIAEGRSIGMPAWGTKVPEQHIWEIVAYLDSLDTPYEPNPPPRTLPPPEPPPLEEIVP